MFQTTNQMYVDAFDMFLPPVPAAIAVGAGGPDIATGL